MRRELPSSTGELPFGDWTCELASSCEIRQASFPASVLLCRFAVANRCHEREVPHVDRGLDRAHRSITEGELHDRRMIAPPAVFALGGVAGDPTASVIVRQQRRALGIGP